MYTFSLIMGFGAMAGLASSAWLIPERLARQVLDGGLAALVGGLIGGRAGEVLLNWPYYHQNPGELLQLQSGGLVWPGSLLGGLLFLGLYAMWIRQPFGLLADRLLPLLVSCTCAAWIGCWSEGCAYGYSIALPFGLPAFDENGVLAIRFPLQLLGALLSLVTFWLVQRLGRRPAFTGKRSRAGESASLGLVLLSAGWFALSVLRADPAPLLAGLSLNIWSAFLIFLFALALLLVPRLLARLRQQRYKDRLSTPDTVELTDSQKQAL